MKKLLILIIILLFLSSCGNIENKIKKKFPNMIYQKMRLSI